MSKNRKRKGKEKFEFDDKGEFPNAILVNPMAAPWGRRSGGRITLRRKDGECGVLSTG